MKTIKLLLVFTIIFTVLAGISFAGVAADSGSRGGDIGEREAVQIRRQAEPARGAVATRGNNTSGARCGGTADVR